MFEHETEGIILEDDCLADPSFFQFCDELIDRYRDDKRVSSICGTSYHPDVDYPYSYYASQFTDVWGWATWKDRWDQLDLAMEAWPRWADEGGLHRMVGSTRRFVAYWRSVFSGSKAGRVDAWDYPWILTRWRLGGVSIHPCKPLVRNVGFGGAATNTLARRAPNYVRDAESIAFPLVHPPVLELDQRTEAHIWRVRFGISWRAALWKRLKAPARVLRGMFRRVVS